MASSDWVALLINIKEEVGKVLKEYVDIFLWNPSNLRTISRDLAQRKLGISEDDEPVIQKKRVFAKARQQVIKKQMTKLQEVGIVKIIEFSVWLCNPVVVPKRGNDGKMCQDYTDLN